jgi:hypothetical protein
MRQRSRPVRHLHCSRSCSPVTLVVSSMLMCRGAATHALYLHSPGIPWHGGQRHTRSRPFRSTVPCTRRSSCKAWMRSLVTHSSFASGPSRRISSPTRAFLEKDLNVRWRRKQRGARARRAGGATHEVNRAGVETALPEFQRKKRTGSPSNGRSLQPGLRVPGPSADDVSDHPQAAGSSDGPSRARGCTGQVRSRGSARVGGFARACSRSKHASHEPGYGLHILGGT